MSFVRPAAPLEEGAGEFAGTLFVKMGVFGAAAVAIAGLLEIADVVKQHRDQRKAKILGGDVAGDSFFIFR